jgi:hypothetical protein
MSTAIKGRAHPVENGRPKPTREEWATHAPALAAWADKYLVNRRDARGGYYRRDGATHPTTRKADDLIGVEGNQSPLGPLSLRDLEHHFKAKGTEAIVGLHSTFRDEAGACWCLWGAIDIDAHPGQKADPRANLRFGLALYVLAKELGFQPLLCDSNGAGGYHLVLLFDRPVPTRIVFAFLQWLIRDYESHGFVKPPELFPKQPGIREGGFGNWLRLPGRHHTRDHYTRVWDGSEWLEGSDAVRLIISTRGAPESAIPLEARPDPNAPFDLGRDIDRKRAQGDGLGSGERKKRQKPDDGSLDAGADFNAKASWESILKPHGWRLDHESEGTGFWTRPDKAAGTSATTGHSEYDTLYMFTNGTTFQKDGSYSKFGAYAVLNHGGDLKEACKALSQGGYGTFWGLIWDESTGVWEKRLQPNPCPAGGKVRLYKSDKPMPGPPRDSKHWRRSFSDGVPTDDPGPQPSANGNGSAPTAGEAPPSRPSVEVNTERHRVLAETMAVLPRDPDLFCRGDLLVRIARQDEDTAKLPGGVEMRNAADSVRVLMMGESGLSCRLTAAADFFSWRKDKNDEFVAVSVHPPGWLVKAVLENGVYPSVRPLNGVAEVPFPRPDGTLVTTPGYDRETGVFFAPTVNIDPIPKSPTKLDAEAAAKLLLGIVEQFPFATEDDRAVWLAGLLTIIARPAIRGPVPGAAFVANKAGTVIGKLIDSVAMIPTGRPVPTTSYPRDDGEASKIKTAFALDATAIVHLDNLDEGRTYGGGVLDSMLTSMVVNDRILGQSKSTRGIELRCCWFLSGNNIVPGKDAYRRWLVCNLATELERPEERNDLRIPDLLSHVHAHRAEYVRAALVILRAHAVAGRPTGGWAALGSFEEWDQVVRGAVWFATGRDCNTTRRKAAEESPDRLNKLALLEAWKDLPGGGPEGSGVTSEEAHRLAFDRKEGEKTVKATNPELGAALARFSRDGKVTARNIGNTIRAMKGQKFDGMAFMVKGYYKRSALWHVTEDGHMGDGNGSSPGESGESGESDPKRPRKIPERTSDMMVSDVHPGKKCNRLETDSSDSPDSPELPYLSCGCCFRADCPECNPRPEHNG